MSTPTYTLTPLSTLAPPSPARAWQTVPHPYLPLAATACSDKIVRIYSLTTFTLQSQITGGHKRSVRAVAWKPGLRSDRESILATGSFDATAGIWKGENSKRRIGGAFLSRERDGNEGAMDGLEDDDDDDEPLDSGDEDDYAYAIQLSGHDSEIKSLTWSPNGTFLATCSRDKSVWIWETLPDEDDNLETVAVLQEHEGDVKSVAWHPSDEGCLASGSYDEHVRIWREDVDGEWTCVGVGVGHEGTVWLVAWEPPSHMKRMKGGDSSDEAGRLENGLLPENADRSAQSGSRIISCSDDLTIRLWRRKPKAAKQPQEGQRLPSIIRSTSDEEDWYEEQQLPKCHDRAIYAVSWSETTGRIVSAGSDGRIVVYEERLKSSSQKDNNESVQGHSDVDAKMTDPQNVKQQVNGQSSPQKEDSATCDSEWHILAEIDAAHGVFEINHVAWARRYDREKRSNDEQVILSTGDDGNVRVWTLDVDPP